MSKVEQNRQQYTEALDTLAFSSETKQRFIQNMLEFPMPAAKRRYRSGKIILAAVVLGALLTVTAAAAVIGRQNQIRPVDSTEEAAWLERESQGSQNNVVVLGTFDGDWEYRPPTVEISAWWKELDVAEAEETQGNSSDSWTKKRTIQEGTQKKTRYLGTQLSDFHKLWSGTPLNTDLLENRYEPVEDAQTCYTCEQGDKLREFSVVSAYTGENGTAFTLEFKCHKEPLGNSYVLSDSYAYTESYDTADGTEVLLSMDRSKTGQSLFWANLASGRYSFHMVGTRMELEDIHALLDSLNLAACFAENDTF
ncbi:hypothetical protein D7X94_06775 [Acutalibacter sp. 1XD8-33]|uniref:hypothetical protein n=1 Tax=Acutalibacter sp. 1XD8-33 TaxID=2320081 RepID=UPI000EA3EF1F|nr:hypothetical protein [Acutalibacter sp. 1XD8-33]RKJ40758.1 hypothetical protein D7X94_06775 [Acutalibacter sp. 1XD8-33]